MGDSIGNVGILLGVRYFGNILFGGGGGADHEDFRGERTQIHIAKIMLSAAHF